MQTTETRSLPWKKYSWYWVQNGFRYSAPNGAGEAYLQSGDQTTTSYRTGRRAAPDPTDGGFVNTSGSQIEFARELKVESDGDLGRNLPDNGHEFSSSLTQHLWPEPQTIYAKGTPYGDLLMHEGYCLPMLSPVMPPMDYPTDHSKVIDGSRLIRMTIPTAPEANLAQFLGELRERLPELPGSLAAKYSATTGKLSGTRDAAAAVGGEHLNMQFGIRPFIQDVQKLSRAVLDVNNIVRQYKRDSGLPIRRRASLDGSASSVQRPDEDVGIATPTFFNLGMPLFAGVPPTTVMDNYHSEVWFSGAYTYHLHEGHSFIDKMERYEQLANKLLGDRLTADVIWQLTPWSWLIDWQSDIGTFLSNISLFSSDSLVLKYGYVMHRTTCTREYRKTGITYSPGSSGPSSLVQFHTITRKERTRASPYGFGVDWTSLSASQLAILAALGLTKSPGGNLKYLN